MDTSAEKPRAKKGWRTTKGLPQPVQQNNNSVSSRRGRRPKQARFGIVIRILSSILRRLGTVSAPSSSSVVQGSAADSTRTMRHPEPTDDPDDLVDEVIVDRIWVDEFKNSVSHSDHAASPDKTASHQHPGTTMDRDSFAVHDGFWASLTCLVVLRWRIWPAVVKFFSLRFYDEKSEEHYNQENWFLRKPLALWSSIFFITNWVLGTIFISRPWALADQIFYGGIGPLFTVPLLLVVMYDIPRDRPYIYQVYLLFCVWVWSLYQILFIYLCGYYNKSEARFSCGTRDFLGLFYYTTALQTIALFGLKLNRFSAVIGAAVFFIIASILVLPNRVNWVRNVINFAVYHGFLIYVHYMRESSERRLYTLRDQLKIQFKATQKAQINERKSADSKRRLTSYVFHDKLLYLISIPVKLTRPGAFTMRVPLNTALLAVQNMGASGTIHKDQEIEFSALEGSLSMMSKVLNDVLDFNRMDSGRFESASRPYAFHHVMRSLFIPLRLAANARNLEFITDLDPNIDLIARRAAYEAMGEGATKIAKHIKANPSVDGMVLGDESRLRQIITNLASNACKFTPAGGKLMITTRLILPSLPPETAVTESEGQSESVQHHEEPSTNALGQHPLSDSHLSRHNLEHSQPRSPLEWIAVRIEVTDTGYGIRAQDMAKSKLFSAFNQTEQGRQQGGKGTGLGLALVRQIVKLSGGRLGVRSKVDEGSTFWVELPLGVGRKAIGSAGPPTPATDINLQTPQSSTLAAESSTNNGTMVVDAAAMHASQMVPTSTRSSSALHSLMEQGGRVELVLSTKQNQRPSVTTRSTGESATTPQDSNSLPTPTEEPGHEPAERPPIVEESSADTFKPVSRPTFVPLPNPPAGPFSADPDTKTSPSSNTMTNFDNNHTRSSPSASTSPSAAFEPGLKVLVVDDDPLTRTLMKRILSRLGCLVSTASNGQQALEMILGLASTMTPSSDTSGMSGPILERGNGSISDQKYAIVFLDNQMPVMSGLKAVEKLRELDRKDFVVGVTGNALLSDQQEYLEAGADHVLTKPVLERNLREMLALADERRKQPPEGEEAS